MNKLYQHILAWWHQKKGIRAIRIRQKKFVNACNLADSLLKTDNKTRYVIQREGGYTILSTNDIDRLKAKKVFKSNVTIFTLLKQCSYVATHSSSLKEAFRKEHATKTGNPKINANGR